MISPSTFSFSHLWAFTWSHCKCCPVGFPHLKILELREFALFIFVMTVSRQLNAQCNSFKYPPDWICNEFLKISNVFLVASINHPFNKYFLATSCAKCCSGHFSGDMVSSLKKPYQLFSFATQPLNPLLMCSKVHTLWVMVLGKVYLPLGKLKMPDIYFSSFSCR